MTKDEYLHKLKLIKKCAQDDEFKLASEFVKANKRFSVGDIIKNGQVIILVEKISVSLRFDVPKALYSGSVLTKKLEKAKRAKEASIADNFAELVKKAGDL